MDIFNPDFKDFINCLNKHNVQYMLVGGYAVILRGYSRSTGDMDIWVNKTQDNYNLLTKAIKEFGLPKAAVPEQQFFSNEYDVFSFGRPPYAIEILTAVKGISSFEEAYKLSTNETVDDLNVRVIDLKYLILSKEAANRHKDKNDIENLPSLD
jgi:hypothetical protein